MSNSIFIRTHLGLGDALIQNGLVRILASNDRVVFPAKIHNFESVKFMFRDLPNVEVVSVRDDVEAELLSEAEASVLRLGLFSLTEPLESAWDRQMYRQARVPFDCRWEAFQVHRDRQDEYPVPRTNYVFLHDDYERGFCIDESRLPSDVYRIRPERPNSLNTIFGWLPLIVEASEIHCIDSCFAILVDSIPTKAIRLVLHDYARKGLPPTYRKKWEHLT